MCVSATCPYNKTGVGADFLCRCEYIRFDYRKQLGIYFVNFPVELHEENITDFWNVMFEYFTHK